MSALGALRTALIENIPEIQGRCWVNWYPPNPTYPNITINNDGEFFQEGSISAFYEKIGALVSVRTPSGTEAETILEKCKPICRDKKFIKACGIMSARVISAEGYGEEQRAPGEQIIYLRSLRSQIEIGGSK